MAFLCKMVKIYIYIYTMSAIDNYTMSSCNPDPTSLRLWKDNSKWLLRNLFSYLDFTIGPETKFEFTLIILFKAYCHTLLVMLYTDYDVRRTYESNRPDMHVRPTTFDVLSDFVIVYTQFISAFCCTPYR